VGSRSRRAVESVFGDMFIHAVCLFAYTPSVDFFCDDAVKTTTQRAVLVYERIVSNVVVWVGDGLERFVVMLCCYVIE